MIKKPGLHPRNKHKNGYHFDELLKSSPLLGPFVGKNKFGIETINFSDAKAVFSLNAALLKTYYRIDFWEIPKGYLCPPIPGRADVIHHLADLLIPKDGEIPRGPKTRMLDIGTGANCVYPLIATSEYGWCVVGSDIDPVAVKNAQTIVDKNKLQEKIKIILQPDPEKILVSCISPDEFFHIVACNPPFHASALEASKASNKKNQNLGLSKNNQNFGGQNNELWCEGGEKAFILKMINESLLYKKNVHWFTCLVSKAETMPFLYEELKKLNIRSIRTIDMAQGQKKSRIIAWSFL